MNLQRLILKLLLMLPAFILRWMSRGTDYKIDGRQLDAKVHFLSAQGSKAPSITAMTPQDARDATHGAFAMLNAPRPSGVDVWEEKVSGPAGDIPVRHYRPAGEAGVLPAMIYFHMGGWVIGDLETCDWLCALLALRCKAHVVSVDYHLAPEHKFPIAMKEALAVYDWAEKGGLGDKVDTKRIGVGGDSAGGGISAVICQERKKEEKSQPKVQLLIYPGLDLAAKGGSMDSCADCYPLTREIMDWFGEHWLNKPEEAELPLVSPAHNKDFSGLAPAIVVTAGFDVLRDQGAAYAKKLEKAGVKTRYHCFDALAHAFTAQAGVIPASKKACEQIAGWTAEAL